MKSLTRFVSRIAIILTFFLTLYVGGSLASAQSVQDFVINDMRVDYQLSNEDPQGLLRTKETISLTFSGQNRGILRAIPESQAGIATNPKVISVTRDGVKEPFITYSENGNLVVRIGDVNTYITGAHSYVIEYQVENVIRFFDDHDELYWNVNGNGWQQAFESVEAIVQTNAMPSREESLQPRCFTGSLGSTEQQCRITEATGKLTFTTTETLQSGETLTFALAYQKGYFTPLSFFERYWALLLGIWVVIVQLLIAVLAFRRWWLQGRDPSRGVTAPYFERPKNVTLLEAGYVSSQSLQPRHITAAIIDLAVRGYIQIVESQDKKPKHELMLKKELDTTLGADELYLLEKLFESTSVGASIRLEDKKQKLYPILNKLKSMADASTGKKGLFDRQPSKSISAMTKYLLLGALSLVVGFITAPATYGLGAIAGFAVFFFIIVLASLMGRRSQSGMYLKEHMDGLKLYLSRSEKERLAAHDAVAAPLAPRSSEPQRTVTFFESLLPYAVALGLEKSWADAFKDIYTQPPEWYQGNWSSFSTATFAHSLTQTANATSASFSAPSSSGSSGFSGGGGSAGGGGGGGGGGGW